MGLFNAQELDKKTRKYLFDIVLTNIRGLRWDDINDDGQELGFTVRESRTRVFRVFGLWVFCDIFPFKAPCLNSQFGPI